MAALYAAEDDNSKAGISLTLALKCAIAQMDVSPPHPTPTDSAAPWLTAGCYQL